MQASVARETKMVRSGLRAFWTDHVTWILPALIIFAPSLLWLWDRWTMSVWQNSHGLTVPLMVGYLVRDALRRDTFNTEESSAWGFLFIIPGLLMVLVDAAIRTQLMAAAGLVLCLPGFSLLLLGARRTKMLIFPWLLAPLMLPIPAAFIQPLVIRLREISAVGAAEILMLLGIPVDREHTLLRMADQSLLVADACSGFSTLYASVTWALFLAYLTTSPTRRFLVLALAVPGAIICNIVRCTALALIANAWGTRYLDTWLHPISGFVCFAAMIFILLAISDPARWKKGVV